MKRLSLLSIVALFCLGFMTPISAQDYPARPVQVYVGFPPGGSADIVGRLIMQKLSDSTGKQFVVENRTGAGGNLAFAATASAKPDGYSLLITPNSPLVFNQLTHKTMGYDPQAFKSVSMISSQPLVMGERGDFPVKTMKE